MNANELESLKKTNAELLLALRDVSNAALPVTNAAYNLGQSHEQWDTIKGRIHELDAARMMANDLLMAIEPPVAGAHRESGEMSRRNHVGAGLRWAEAIAKERIEADRTPAANAVVQALKGKIPLVEPVYIGKALRAGREAQICLSGGTGPLACVMLVNIQLSPWIYTEETAKAFADGYNRALNHLRGAVLEVVEQDRAAATSAGGLLTGTGAEVAGPTWARDDEGKLYLIGSPDRTTATSAGDYDMDDRDLARRIMTFMGRATSGSNEPGADPLADRLAEKLAEWTRRTAAVGAGGQVVMGGVQIGKTHALAQSILDAMTDMQKGRTSYENVRDVLDAAHHMNRAAAKGAA